MYKLAHKFHAYNLLNLMFAVLERRSHPQTLNVYPVVCATDCVRFELQHKRSPLCHVEYLPLVHDTDILVTTEPECECVIKRFLLVYDLFEYKQNCRLKYCNGK